MTWERAWEIMSAENPKTSILKMCFVQASPNIFCPKRPACDFFYICVGIDSVDLTWKRAGYIKSIARCLLRESPVAVSGSCSGVFWNTALNACSTARSATSLISIFSVHLTSFCPHPVPWEHWLNQTVVIWWLILFYITFLPLLCGCLVFIISELETNLFFHFKS